MSDFERFAAQYPEQLAKAIAEVELGEVRAQLDAARAELEHWRSAALDHGHPDAHSWSLSTDDMKAQLLTAKAEGAREALEAAADEIANFHRTRPVAFWSMAWQEREAQIAEWLRARAREGR